MKKVIKNKNKEEGRKLSENRKMKENRKSVENRERGEKEKSTKKEWGKTSQSLLRKWESVSWNAILTLPALDFRPVVEWTLSPPNSLVWGVNSLSKFGLLAEIKAASDVSVTADCRPRFKESQAWRKTTNRRPAWVTSLPQGPLSQPRDPGAYSARGSVECPVWEMRLCRRFCALRARRVRRDWLLVCGSDRPIRTWLFSIYAVDKKWSGAETRHATHMTSLPAMTGSPVRLAIVDHCFTKIVDPSRRLSTPALRSSSQDSQSQISYILCW